MGKKSVVKKTSAILLLCSMLLSSVVGCGNSSFDGNENEASPVSQNNNENSQNSQEPGEVVAMGRYMEEVSDLSEMISGYNNDIFKLEDGSLVITDRNKDFVTLKNGGTTWETDQRDWLTQMLENETYIMSIAVGKDNTAAVIYEVKEETQSEEEESFHTAMFLIRPDGTQVPVDIQVTEEDMYPRKVWIADSGRIFVTTIGSNIYEVYEDGSSEKFLTVEDRPELLQFQGNLMIMDGYFYEGLLIYDMEEKKYVEDEVLKDFIEQNYGDRGFNGGSWFDMYFFMGEDNVLYLAGKKGLHRHVIGGSAIEQVIDGNLCSFGNPAYGLFGMIALENNEFMALFHSGRLVRFTYDPDVPTVPNEKLKVYSLKENDTLRQAINLYQATYPEVYVEYEIGMEEGSAVTREDALKKLNTDIMAGEGPDLMDLDNMPLDSYREKGFLMDLSPVLDGLSGEDALFTNIVDAFRTEDKIYALPCEFELPVISGDGKYISKMNDLGSIADAVEELRKDNPSKNIVKFCTEKGIMRMFSMVSVPYWKNEKNEMNKEAISEYLLQMKRIFDAQMDGLSKEEIESYHLMNQYYAAESGVIYDDSAYLRAGVDELDYLSGNCEVILGTLGYAYAYAELTSVQSVKGYENNQIIPMDNNVFVAHTIVGINAASSNTKKAEDFIRMLLGKENQSSLFYGFAVNQAAFEESFVISEDEVNADGIYSVITMYDSDGVGVSLDIYWPDADQTDTLRKWIESVDTPYIEDTVMEEVVYEEGIDYLQGNQSLEEALSAIEKKISIYMAE